jgi:diguanylate cyclase (GGDEF)-like protein/PAS domain S-box-containing protein
VARREKDESGGGELALETDRLAGALGPEAYRALYDNSPDGVLFTAPDGRVLAANAAACELLGRSEDEICALGRHGLNDRTDRRWGLMLAEREHSDSVRGVARMIRGDGTVIEVEMSARMFSDSDGSRRTCTIIRDVTERVLLERELMDANARLHELTITDDLTGLRNRRGFVDVGRQLLELADLQICSAHLLFLDVDEMKELNDASGHRAGDAALRAVARALGETLRHADAAARLGGDEFVALALGLSESDHEAIEQRIHEHLYAERTVTAVGRAVKISIGWATRNPGDAKLIEDLMSEADSTMYRAKAGKGERRGRFELDPQRLAHG